jgi:hypothetical protein
MPEAWGAPGMNILIILFLFFFFLAIYMAWGG